MDMGKKVIKKRRRRIRWKTVIPMLIALVLVVYLFVSLIGMFFGGKDSKDGFTACKLSTSKLQKKLSKKNTVALWKCRILCSMANI